MRLLAGKLVRSFGVRRIFGPLTFQAEAGRVLGIAGTNGSGKTTLLRVLAGLLRPSGGNVTIEADGIARAPRDAASAIGWCGPDLSLYGELTPAENLAFFARVAGHRLEPAGIDERIAAVGLDPARLRTIPLRALSTGQRQRIKLAYAVLCQAPVLLLDEPGSNLDEKGRAVVERLVADQRTRGLTILASNDPRELALADEVVSL